MSRILYMRSFFYYVSGGSALPRPSTADGIFHFLSRRARTRRPSRQLWHLTQHSTPPSLPCHYYCLSLLSSLTVLFHLRGLHCLSVTHYALPHLLLHAHLSPPNNVDGYPHPHHPSSMVNRVGGHGHRLNVCRKRRAAHHYIAAPRI